MRRRPFTFAGEWKSIFRLLLAGKWVSGPAPTELETRFRTLVGTEHAVCTCYGIQALHIILDFYGFDESAELLIPSYTAYVIKELLDEIGVKYDIVDIDPKRACMTAETLKKKIKAQTKGVLITHLLGNVCDEDVFAAAREHGIVVIEDCAHSHGAASGEKMAGSLGDAAFFSFGYAKIINSFHGGILLTGNAKLAEYARKKTQDCAKPGFFYLLKKILFGHVEIAASWPGIAPLARLCVKNQKFLRALKDILNLLSREKVTSYKQYSNLQAALALQQLDRLSAIIAERRSAAEYVKAKLRNRMQFLERRPGDVIYNFVARVPSAEDAHRFLFRHGIDTGLRHMIMAPMAEPAAYPGLQEAMSSYLQLPHYNGITTADLDTVVQALDKYLLNGRGSA